MNDLQCVYLKIYFMHVYGRSSRAARTMFLHIFNFNLISIIEILFIIVLGVGKSNENYQRG